MKNTPTFYQIKHGTEYLKQPVILALIIFSGITISYLLVKIGLVVALLFFAIPLLFYFLYLVFTYPKIGIYAAILLAFVVNGLSRFVPNVPIGLGIDGLLLLTLIAIAVKKIKYDWKDAQSGLMLAALIWLLYNILELFNPEAPSFEAWFYAMRGVSFYMFLTIPISLVLFKNRKDLDFFLEFWLCLSVLGSLYGIKQQFLGVNSYEQAWLNAGAAKQHILFGRLRVFSFYSDAGQFGASQAHALVLAVILLLQRGLSFSRRLFLAVVTMLSLYGMMISGTRGAMAVPAIGFMTYFFMSKNFKVFGGGILLGGVVFYLLKFTFIGQGVYEINRMRTALDPNDASLLVRVENQRKLAHYLENRPFGGGIGSAGNWGLRFSPNSFLAQTPTDSWFVRIWAEEGIVGLSLHLFILLYIAIKGGILLWNLPNKHLRQQLLAIHAGTLGIYVASYGNGILGQMPTGILLYIGWSLLFKAKKLGIG